MTRPLYLVHGVDSCVTYLERDEPGGLDFFVTGKGIVSNRKDVLNLTCLRIMEDSIRYLEVKFRSTNLG